jgi:glycosyltransferase involved in cell wall biosynthesis
MISIIIPAHNEEEYIEQCLQSIKGDHEIIVVCDACGDTTKKIALKYTKNVYGVYERNVSAARNYGAAKATGDTLVFVDADSVLTEGVLQKIQEAIDAGAVAGTVRSRSLEDLWRANLLWGIAHTFRTFFYRIFPTASGLLFCRTDAFAMVHGFTIKKKLAEDTHLLLQLRKKGKVVYIGDVSIKTSSRRLEKEGYLWTLFRQYMGFFFGKKGY